MYVFTFKDPASSSLDLLEEEESVIRTPYYLENFRTIISAVLSYEDNAKLFSADDKRFIDVFGELSGKLISYNGHEHVYACTYEIKLKV